MAFLFALGRAKVDSINCSWSVGVRRIILVGCLDTGAKGILTVFVVVNRTFG